MIKLLFLPDLRTKNAIYRASSLTTIINDIKGRT